MAACSALRGQEIHQTEVVGRVSAAVSERQCMEAVMTQCPSPACALQSQWIHQIRVCLAFQRRPAALHLAHHLGERLGPSSLMGYSESEAG